MTTPARFGDLLRGWRMRRRLSQLELAGEAGISTRHRPDARSPAAR